MASSLGSSGAKTYGREHRWKVLGVGVAANVSFFAAFAGIPATAVLMRADYHLSNPQLGLALGLLGLGIAVSELPWGLITDRLGDRRVLLAGLIATSLALALMALTGSPHGARVPAPWLLTGGLFMVGFLGGSINGASGRAVMAWFAEGERGFAMSVRQTAVPAGGGLGALVLPTLVDHQGFATAYAGLAALCAISAGFTWHWLHEPPAEPATRTSTAAARTAVTRGPLRQPQVWRVAGAIGLLCVPQCAVIAFASVFLSDFSHAALAGASLALVLVQTGAAVTRIAGGRWTDRRRNRRPYLRACSLATALIFGMLGLAVIVAQAGWLDRLNPGSPMIFLLLVGGGICGSAWHGVAFTELATLAGAGRAGTALGLGNSFAFIALFLTSLAIPALLTLGAWPLVWLAAAACALLAWPVFPAASPKPASV